jgi:hypothetical protein
MSGVLPWISSAELAADFLNLGSAVLRKPDLAISAAELSTISPAELTAISPADP